MYLVRPSWLMRKAFPSATWRMASGEKKIFLTFDDGPIPVITPWVLVTLKEYNAKATFFAVGSNIEKHADIFAQIIAEGHSTGNHTHTHLNGWKTKNKEYLDSVSQCNSVISSYPQLLTGKRLPLFRPPYGKMKKNQVSALKPHYSLIMWDVLSGDFDPAISGEKCLKNVLNKTREGSIVVFHDSLKAKNNLYYALPKFLDHFSRQGWQFLPL